jgi:GrpB-like predicted nucleotidyltransferase (UPF0157 family)
MTKIDEMTDEQVLALSEEEIADLIKYGMAVAGIPVYAVPVEPHYETVVAPDAKVYEIAGVSLDDRAAAERIQSAIAKEQAKFVQLGYAEGDYTVRYVERSRTTWDVSTRTAYSQETWAKHRDVLKRNAAKKAEYDALKRSWDQAERDARSVRSAVTDRIDEVRERQARREMLTDRYVEYIGIAGGDKNVAMEFLRRAFDLTDDEAELLRIS